MYTEYDQDVDDIGNESFWQLLIATLVFFILYCSVLVICKVRSLF